MSQIFISHSQKDQPLKDFIANAFAITKVKAVFEEYEKILNGTVTADKIAGDIENSQAVFVLLSDNVQNIPHTRDWVVWETGIAKNKDIWVFEPYFQSGKISVVTPYLKHYVVYSTHDSWLAYIRQIIESYDDSHVLSTMLLAGGAGAMLAEKNKGPAALLGALAGVLLSDKSGERPSGNTIMCNNCFSSYSIHLPISVDTFRCPVCNSAIKLNT